MRNAFVFSLLLFITSNAIAQIEKVDTAVVSKLRREGTDRSQVMKVLEMVTDVHGPRLTNSTGYKNAANYAKGQLSDWGVENVHVDTWDESFGRGWNLKKFSLQGNNPEFVPLIAYPKAWSPGVKGLVKGEVVFLDVSKE